MSKYSEQILSILVQYDNFVTANELSKLLSVSKKTIYRSISQINKKSENTVIESERGRGYRVNYPNYLKSNIGLKDFGFVDYSPVERRNQIMMKILFRAPFSLPINKLFEKYHVSSELRNQDISVIKSVLKTYDLSVYKKTNKISVFGTEESIRKAINNILIHSKTVNPEILSEPTDGFPDINIFDNQFLTKQIQWIENYLGASIPYPYNINIFSHLYILIIRFRQGKVDESNKINTLSLEEKKTISENKSFFSVAKDVIKNTAEYINQNIPIIESYYLLQYLISIHYDHELTFEDKTPEKVIHIVNKYLNGFGMEKNQSKSLKTLRNDLIGHIKPMINRLQNNITVNNKLLSNIKTEYGDLFNKVKNISKNIEKESNFSISISDDEVGFLTLYFARYFEEIHTQKSVIIMCASGIGTSKLLFTKVKKFFPDLNILAVLSVNEYKKNANLYSEADLIISTINVDVPNEIPMVLSTAMFTQTDRKRVEQALNGE
ncbi:PRD domain-containing protein [Ligilactobacillus pobuzihii]|uniref:PRD domain-containing protein n=1 Tax=Ligilactobacillus pobuzihii TaxID=449659 RepID=UPI0019D1FA53|nr:PRD domain-containing protein [Ligilactobacillus pobuzihii]